MHMQLLKTAIRTHGKYIELDGILHKISVGYLRYDMRPPDQPGSESATARIDGSVQPARTQANS